MKGLADLLDSDMEDSTNFLDENSVLSSASDASAGSSANGNHGKRGKKRHRVTMPPKSRSKVQKTSSVPAKQPTAKQAASKRKALEEQINDRDVELDENAEAVPEVAPPSRKRPLAPLQNPEQPERLWLRRRLKKTTLK